MFFRNVFGFFVDKKRIIFVLMKIVSEKKERKIRTRKNNINEVMGDSALWGTPCETL